MEPKKPKPQFKIGDWVVQPKVWADEITPLIVVGIDRGKPAFYHTATADKPFCAGNTYSADDLRFATPDEIVKVRGGLDS